MYVAGFLVHLNFFSLILVHLLPAPVKLSATRLYGNIYARMLCVYIVSQFSSDLDCFRRQTTNRIAQCECARISIINVTSRLLCICFSSRFHRFNCLLSFSISLSLPCFCAFFSCNLRENARLNLKHSWTMCTKVFTINEHKQTHKHMNEGTAQALSHMRKLINMKMQHIIINFN